MIDLRSDTVTRPSAPMLAAMTAAEVGDDVWGDDPTVARLQAVVAERAGKEAALFFPSGTQSNLAALMSHCERGDEYIVGQAAHTYKYEGGGAAVLGSIQPQPIENAADGTLPLEKIAAAIKPTEADDTRRRGCRRPLRRACKAAAVESEPSIALGVAVRNAPTRRRCPASASGLST
ncbi:L-allo-threonine aldolase [Burkholderia pseudomallei]|nr:L-allo-threonine aldolase [Burkholderia pseudomallei]